MSTDPTALAREVLDLAHEDETVTVCSIPDRKATALARAVLELTEKVERMEALADRLERLAAWERTPPSGLATASPYADGLEEAAARIRAALNEGGDR